MAKKILLPVDRVRNSLEAEQYAIKLSTTEPLKVTLLHVINERNLNDRGINESLMEMILAKARDHAASVLTGAAGEFKKAGVEHSLQIEYGLPGPVICRTAVEDDYDQVFITESGYSELGELLTGSVVSYVTHHCRIPVLVLKHSQDKG